VGGLNMTDWKTIPGETPIDDISGLKIKSVRTRQMLNVVEGENIRAAYTKYLGGVLPRRKAPFNIVWVKKLHKEMFGKVWVWAGEIRRRELNLGVASAQIEMQLQQLMDDLGFWEQHKLPMQEQAAMLHHRAVSIHPFLNGNGRWARLLANIWLKLHQAPLTMWPEETIGGESIVRQEYLRAIRAADAGDYILLIELHRRFTA